MTPWSKPTIDTKFHIDYGWWETSGRSFRLYLLEQLCDQCKQRFTSHRATETVDWVDPETGEVTEADALLQCLKNMCASDPEFIDPRIPLTAAVFRLLLVSDNKPMSPREMNAVIAWKPPETILSTLGGKSIFLGIRPV